MMTNELDVRRAKDTLRATVRARREAIDHAELMRKSLVIERTIAAMDEYRRARTILLYASARDEVHTMSLIEAALADGKKVALPHMTVHHTLEPRLVTDTGELKRNRYEILEPTVRAPLVDPAAIDLAIMPGVAFDEEGRRLGMGKGCYDRLLPALANAKTVGLAFEEQVVKSIPFDGHDRPVGMVVTERRVIAGPSG